MIKKITMVLTVIIIIGLMGTIETTYTRKAIVVNVDNLEVTAEDKQGNLWVFIADGYSINDGVTLIMNDNHTTKITDDKIIKVK